MPLVSAHFSGNDRLEKCLLSDPHHVLEGNRGEYVGLIQAALMKLGIATIAASEIATEYYGPSTSSAVLKFKGPPRNILNKQLGQTRPDPIVGKLTLKQLDKEMAEFEKLKLSVLVSPTKDGANHNHATCPPIMAGIHAGTPINPLRWKRMVNLYGDGETKYLGFEDYAIDPSWRGSTSGLRPLTWEHPSRGGLKDQSVSDLCMRNSPVYDDNDLKAGLIKPRSTTAEIKRILMPGARITYAGTEENIKLYFHKIARLAAIIETNFTDDQGNLLPLGSKIANPSMTIHVMTFLG